MDATTAFVKPENKETLVKSNSSIEATERDNKKRRKVVIAIGVVTFVLVILSILLMAITIHMTPSIDEKIRKEHEDLVKKMSEGALKSPINNTRSGFRVEEPHQSFSH